MNDIVEKFESLGLEWKEEYENIAILVLQRVDEDIKNLCNTSIVPEGLKYTRRDMIVGYILRDLKLFGRLTDVDFERVVASIAEGDTNISYVAGTDPETAFDGYISSICNPDANQFLRYRKLVW